MDSSDLFTLNLEHSMRLLLSGSKSSSTFCPFLVMPLVQHHEEQNGGANQWGGFPKLSPARNFITARTSTLESPLLAGSPMTIFLAGRGRGRPRRPFQIKSRRRRNNGREKRWAVEKGGERSREKGRIFESLDLCRGRSAEYITLSKWIEEPPTVSTYLGRKRTFA